MRSFWAIGLFWGLIGAMAFSTWAHIRQHRYSRRLEDVVYEVHDMLVVWAEMWPDLKVRERLLDCLRHRRRG